MSKIGEQMAMNRLNEKLLVIMLGDLVQNELLSNEEAEKVRQVYLKSEAVSLTDLDSEDAA